MDGNGSLYADDFKIWSRRRELELSFQAANWRWLSSLLSLDPSQLKPHQATRGMEL